MTWTSVSPIGGISVKANRSTMAANTAYIGNTMGITAAGTSTPSTKDHFWNVSSTLDGHHRFVRSPKFESPAGTAADPAVGTGMDGVQYIKLVNANVGRVECFYQNAQGIYQTSPSFVSGSVAVTSSFSNLATPMPQNVYGEIFMFIDDNIGGSDRIGTGFFKTNTSSIQVLATRCINVNDIQVSNLFLSSTGLQLRVATDDGTNGTYVYRITYRAI